MPQKKYIKNSDIVEMLNHICSRSGTYYKLAEYRKKYPDRFVEIGDKDPIYYLDESYLSDFKSFI